MAPNLPLTGGCHCGTLRYEISGAPILTYTCHCTDCQRITGTAFSLAIIVPDSAFRLVKGEPRSVERIAASGRVNIRLLCPDCGCWISGIGRPNEAGVLVRRVRAGTLDDRSWLRPTEHYFTRSKQPWVTLPAGDDIYEAQAP
ncbi:MAG TPA: GFA family protein [Stellaceae bacterium]|nr:GFA family protein [Stellaceae bacterium]